MPRKHKKESAVEDTANLAEEELLRHSEKVELSEPEEEKPKEPEKPKVKIVYKKDTAFRKQVQQLINEAPTLQQVKLKPWDYTEWLARLNTAVMNS